KPSTCSKRSDNVSRSAVLSFTLRRPRSCTARTMTGGASMSPSSSTSSATPFGPGGPRIDGGSSSGSSRNRVGGFHRLRGQEISIARPEGDALSQAVRGSLSENDLVVVLQPLEQQQ